MTGHKPARQVKRKAVEQNRCGDRNGGYMNRIAYFEIGRKHDESIKMLNMPNVDSIPIMLLYRLNFMKYDIIIIPSYYNQDVLFECRNRLLKFVKYGGILIFMGFVADKNHWLQLCTYSEPYLASVRFHNQDSHDFKAIFNGIDLNNQTALKFHDWGIAHGSYSCSNDNCTALVTGEHEQDIVMAILQPSRFNGKLFITTLDPDLHSVMGYTLTGHKNLPIAQKLLQNIFKWADELVLRQNRGIYVLRRIVGLPMSTIASNLIMALLVIVLLSLAAKLSNNLANEQFIAVTGVATLLSLVLSIIGRK